jgi:uncharacterized membrane protein
LGVNLSPLDRAIRVVIGVALLAVGLIFVRGILGIVLAVIGGVLVFSGTVGFCHVYKFFGICSANKKAE